MRFHRPVPLTRPARVSVVIPCYKYGKYLPGAVRSALDQPGVEVDVLIVDDASPDDSAEVAHGLARADSRVRVLVNKLNQGHIATYNRGIAAVDGDFVVLLSADDLLAPGSLSRAVALMQAHPGVGFTYGYSQEFWEEVPIARGGPALWTTWPGHEWVGILCRRGRNLIFNPEVVMRREVMTRLGAYDPRLPHSGDMELWMRAALHWEVGRVMGPDQGFYRRHGDNMQLATFGGVLDDLVGRRQAFERTLQDSAVGIMTDPERQRRHRQASRVLAREAVELGIRAFDSRRPDAGERSKEYLSFAEETWPSVRHTSLWRAAEERMRQGAQFGSRSWAAENARVLRDKVRWRVWRRFGV
jgi:glycosyltransferase involved in cell wall biosynthesis